MEIQQSDPGSQSAQTQINVLHRQCAWCGLRMSGPLTGRKALDAGGKVIPLVGYTHGICNGCREAWLADAKQSNH